MSSPRSPSPPPLKCDVCSKIFDLAISYNSHISCLPCEYFIETESSCKGRVKTFTSNSNITISDDLHTALTTLVSKIVCLLEESLIDFKKLKYNIFIICEFINLSGEVSERNFKTSNTLLTRTSDIQSILNKNTDKLESEMRDYEQKDSGWSYNKLIKVELRINQY